MFGTFSFHLHRGSRKSHYSCSIAFHIPTIPTQSVGILRYMDFLMELGAT